jgi:hypothetical protein
MHQSARASLLVAAVFLTASCSDTDARLAPTRPSQLGTSLLTVHATSETAVAEAVSNPFCPTVTPFNVRLGVIVRATGSSPVIVTGIRLRFTDISGRQAPQVTLPMLPVTLPAPELIPQFGGSARTFPVTLGIGCGTDPRGTVLIIVETSDNQGQRMAEQVTVAVR